MPAVPAAIGQRVTVICPACYRALSIDLGVHLPPVDYGCGDDDMFPARVGLAFHLGYGCTRASRT